MLVNGLPPEAAIFRVEGQQWTMRDEFDAQILEAVDRWGWVNARLSVDRKHHKQLPDAPVSVPRPGEEQRKGRDQRDRVVTDAREIAAFFGK